MGTCRSTYYTWPAGAAAAAVLLVAVLVPSLVLISATSAPGGSWAGDPYAHGRLDKASTHYIVLDPSRRTGQERVLCLARGRCFLNILTCPKQCPQRKPRRNRLVKGCFMDCSSRCETTCKRRKPNCEGYGSICYDPRFVGGDGVMFYFHGAKGGDFALVSDDQLHINGHFIGTRLPGRARDFTWVQALAIMFESHSLEVAARTVADWDDAVDALTLRWDGQEIAAVTESTTEDDGDWRVMTGEEGREVVVERTDAANSARLSVAGLVEIDVKVRPIGEEEDRVHGYHLPPGDAFAHLEMQFRFANLTDGVEGVLGRTYRPGYVSPVKKGVAMPMMGGEDKYRVSSFLSTGCVACRFSRPAAAAETHLNGGVQRLLPSSGGGGAVAHDGAAEAI